MSKVLYLSGQDGVYGYRFDGRSYVKQNFTPMDKPMYVVAEDGRLHILLRSLKDGESGYVSYSIKDGKLISPTDTISTKGECACHLCLASGKVYAVNYGSGSVFYSPSGIVYHGKNSHPHFIGLTPDKKYLAVTDLGLDKIFVYDLAFNPISQTDMPKGSGVRHLAFDGDYAFTANEYGCSVSALKYADGKFSLIHTVPCVKVGGKDGYPSAIRVYNGDIFVAVRGYDQISRLRFKDGKLELVDEFSCGGKVPRDFIFDGNRLIVCNQKSDTVTVFTEGQGEFTPIQTLAISAPMCATVI